MKNWDKLAIYNLKTEQYKNFDLVFDLQKNQSINKNNIFVFFIFRYKTPHIYSTAYKYIFKSLNYMLNSIKNAPYSPGFASKEIIHYICYIIGE